MTKDELEEYKKNMGYIKIRPCGEDCDDEICSRYIFASRDKAYEYSDFNYDTGWWEFSISECCISESSDELIW